MNKKKTIVGICLNSLIVIGTIIALGLATIDVKTMKTTYGMLFKYFTTLSNLFLFVAAILWIIYQILYLNKKIKQLPVWLNIVKLAATVSTTITFLVVLCFLLPAGLYDSTKFDPAFLFKGSNAFFHLITPIIGVVSLLLFEDIKQIKYPQTLFSLIFVLVYEIFYTVDYFVQFMPEDGAHSHDWYGFITSGKFMIPIVLIAFIGITILISWLLWFGNRKINVFKKKTASK